jgi:hypothetical protein
LEVSSGRDGGLQPIGRCDTRGRKEGSSDEREGPRQRIVPPAEGSAVRDGGGEGRRGANRRKSRVGDQGRKKKLNLIFV